MGSGNCALIQLSTMHLLVCVCVCVCVRASFQLCIDSVKYHAYAFSFLFFLASFHLCFNSVKYPASAFFFLFFFFAFFVAFFLLLVASGGQSSKR